MDNLCVFGNYTSWSDLLIVLSYFIRLSFHLFLFICAILQEKYIHGGKIEHQEKFEAHK